MSPNLIMLSEYPSKVSFNSTQRNVIYSDFILKMVSRNDSSSNHITHVFKTMESLAFTWFFNSCDYFPEKEKVCWLPYLTYPQENCGTVSFTPRLSFLQLFPGLPRPLAEMKLEEDTTRCHRISIKRWTWLDPPAIARCGYSHSQQALQSFTTVTGASGLLDKLTQHISLPFN